MIHSGTVTLFFTLNEIINYYAAKENLSQQPTGLYLVTLTLLLDLTTPSFIWICAILPTDVYSILQMTVNETNI